MGRSLKSFSDFVIVARRTRIGDDTFDDRASGDVMTSVASVPRQEPPV